MAETLCDNLANSYRIQLGRYKELCRKDYDTLFDLTESNIKRHLSEIESAKKYLAGGTIALLASVAGMYYYEPLMPAFAFVASGISIADSYLKLKFNSEDLVKEREDLIKFKNELEQKERFENETLKGCASQ